MKPQIFKQIEKFYQDLNKDLIQVEGDVCKECQCNECCTFAARGGRHYVTQIELDYIEEFYRESGYPQGSVALFQEYLARKKNEKGEIVHGICPFYNLEKQGCSIYEARPLSCRLYGSYFTEGFPIPPRCYFFNRGRVIKARSNFVNIPITVELSEIQMEEEALRPVLLSKMNPANPSASEKDNEQVSDEPPIMEWDDDLFGGAFKLAQSGKFEEALAAYSQALVKNPRCSFIPCFMGNIYLGLKRFEEAARSYEEAVSLRPNNAHYHFMLAQVYGMLQQIDKTVHEFEEVVRLNPDNALAHAFLGRILEKRGRQMEGIEHYKKALEIDPHFAG